MEKYRNAEVVRKASAVGEKRGGGVRAVGKSSGGDGGRIRKSVETVVRLGLFVRKVKEVVDDERVSVTGDEEELGS